MSIKKACKKAHKEGKAISRRSWGKYGMRLIPTNSWNCVIIISGSNNKPISSRWNPYLDDLIADDWYVCIQAVVLRKRQHKNELFIEPSKAKNNRKQNKAA